MGSRTRLGFIHVVVAACMVLLLAACGGAREKAVQAGPSDEEVIAQGLAKELDPLKDLSAQDAVDLLGSDYDAITCELLSRLFRGFDYHVDAVKVDGETAKATVTVTSLDAEAVVARASERLQQDEDAQAMADYFASEDPESTSEMTDFAWGVVLECLDEATETKTSEVELTLTKKDDTWSLDPDSLSALIDAISP